MAVSWTKTTIGAIAEVTDYVANGSFATLRENVHYKNEEDYAVLVRLADYTNNFDKSKFVYIDEHAYNFLAKSRLEGGEIIMSNVGSIGKLFICPVLDKPMSLAPNSILIRTPYNKFFYYLLSSHHYQTAIKGISSQTALPKFNKTEFKKITVSIPDINEQKRIVEELDLLTDIIDKKNAQLRDLDALAQSIFYEMFGDPVTNDKDWPQKTLNTVCDVRDGTHDSPKYLTYSDYILVTSKNIIGDTIDYSNSNYISKEDYDAINKRSKVDEGDIIMAMIGTIGKPVIVHNEGYNFCVKNVALIKFPSNSEVNNVYIRALLNSQSYSNYILSLNKGGTQKFVALGTLRGLPIPVPPMHILEDFSIRISSIEKQSHLIRNSIAELKQLLHSRMSQIFTQG